MPATVILISKWFKLPHLDQPISCVSSYSLLHHDNQHFFLLSECINKSIGPNFHHFVRTGHIQLSLTKKTVLIFFQETIFLCSSPKQFNFLQSKLTIRHHGFDGIWPHKVLPILFEIVLLQQCLQSFGAVPEFLWGAECFLQSWRIPSNQLHGLLGHVTPLIQDLGRCVVGKDSAKTRAVAIIIELTNLNSKHFG